METVKINVNFERLTERNRWQIKIQKKFSTVCQLQYKLRKFAKLNEGDGCFLFFEYVGFLGIKKERLYPGNKLLSEIQDELKQEILTVKMLIDNAFGNLDRKYVSSQILELKNGACWILTIRYSYYSLYEYTDTFVLKNMEDAIRKLAFERTHDKLMIKDKNNVEVNITSDL